jgi:lipopolysaccharide transport system ATP-binding protein
VNGAIVFDQVWKKFRRGEHHDSLRDLLPSLARRTFRRRPPAGDLPKSEFWALRDVSFEVKPGEALGIVGHNGAGKSTVLKLLTRILKPTRGACEVRGRVGALIEVAAGFHPDLTGRENIYLQGAIVGMTRAEIARKFDQIVEFAGVEPFIDTPVKRFSSGMHARLGFAIAASLDPDVLIIDEVLSVGDAAFQARCATRMRELTARGVPLIFVSHNLPSVLDLCTHAILLGQGREICRGTPAAVVQQYQRAVWTQDDGSMPAAGIRIRGARLLDASGANAELVGTLDPLTIRVEYESIRDFPQMHVAVDIHRADGVYCAGLSTSIDGAPLAIREGTGHVDLAIDALRLLPGAYSISVGLHCPGGVTCDLRMFAHPFTITSTRCDLGLIALDHRWRHRPDNGMPLLHSELATS